MREVFISIIAFLAIATPSRCSENKDGFNFYKDYIRARYDDDGLTDDYDSGDRMLYFYRTPLQLSPGLLPAIEQEYRKRTGNMFKNHMLNKESWRGVTLEKRTSKTALAQMLQSKEAPYNTVENRSDENIELPEEDINQSIDA